WGPYQTIMNRPRYSIATEAVSPETSPRPTTGRKHPTWDVERQLTEHRGRINALAAHPGEAVLATAGTDRTVRLWDVATGRSRRPLTGHSDEVFAVAFSPDGKWLASAGGDRTVRFWDAASGTAGTVLTGHTQAVRALAFDREGRLASAGE